MVARHTWSAWGCGNTDPSQSNSDSFKVVFRETGVLRCCRKGRAVIRQGSLNIQRESSIVGCNSAVPVPVRKRHYVEGNRRDACPLTTYLNQSGSHDTAARAISVQRQIVNPPEAASSGAHHNSAAIERLFHSE